MNFPLKKRRRGGFTMLEVLLAVSIFSIVAASSYGIFAMGIQIWRRAQGRSLVERKAILALEKMAKDLRMSVRTAPEDLRGSGDSGTILIPSIVQVLDTKYKVDMMQYGFVQYRWERARNELCRQELPATVLYTEKEGPCKAVAEHIRNFRIRYLVYEGIGEGYSWYDEWDKKDRFMPLAAEIQLELAPLLKGEKIPVKRTFKKTVFIPVGGKFEEQMATVATSVTL